MGVIGVTLVISYLTLVVGELVPKRTAPVKTAQVSEAFGPALVGFAVLMEPIIWVLSTSTDALVIARGGSSSA